MTFDPNDHITKLPQGKDHTSDYLEVKWRLCWFRDQCAGGTIETSLVTLDLDRETSAEVYVWNEATKRKEKVVKVAKGWCLFRATVTDGKGATATAHGSEGAADFGDYIEKAETKSVGRALAYLGFGTQFAPELNEGERIVDSPVEPNSAPQPKLGTAAKLAASLAGQLTDTDKRMAQVKALFLTLYKPDRWDSFKVRVLGVPVADDGLSIDELDRLYMALMDARHKAKAS